MSQANPVTAKECAKILGISDKTIHRERKRPGFPSREIDGETRYVPEEVRAWRGANIKPREKRKVKPSGKTKPLPSSAAIAKPNDPDILELMSGRATPLSIMRMALQIAARQLGQAACSGAITANQLDGIKKTGQELRAAEIGYIELEKEKRGLIPRSEVAAVIGAMTARLVRAWDNLTNSLPSEVEVWLSTASDKQTDERGRLVREWANQMGAEVLNREADEVERLIHAGDSPE